jgi:excisionase family DNA binding protein
MTPREAAQRLETTTSTIYRLCGHELLRHVRVGVGRGSIVIRESDLAEFLDRNTVEPNGERPAKVKRPPLVQAPPRSSDRGSKLDLGKAVEDQKAAEAKKREKRSK